jgi:xylulokinase
MVPPDSFNREIRITGEKMLLLGIDIGTSGCKATVVTCDGDVKAQAYCEYNLLMPEAGVVELNPSLVYISVCDVLQKVLADHRNKEVGAICVSSFGEAVVPVDANGEALHREGDCGKEWKYTVCVLQWCGD